MAKLQEREEMLLTGKSRLKRIIEKSTWENLIENVTKEITMLYSCYAELTLQEKNEKEKKEKKGGK